MFLTGARALILCCLFSASTLFAEEQKDFLGSLCRDTFCDNGQPCLSVLDQSTCSSNGMPDSMCTCGGIGEVLDPFFTGFSGQQFYFPAEAGETYNLFSSQDHVLNARFTNNSLIGKPDYLAVASEAENSSYIGAIALLHKDNKIEVLGDEMGKMSVILNGEGLDFGMEFEASTDMHFGNTVKLHLDGLSFELSDVLLLETELLQLTVRAENYYIHNLGYGIRGHLDTQIVLKADRTNVPQAHGILGQTIDPSMLLRQQDHFSVFGTASDYAVSDLYASDFIYDLFTPDKVELEDSAAKIQASRGDFQQLTQISRRFLKRTEDFVLRSPKQLGALLTAVVESRR